MKLYHLKYTTWFVSTNSLLLIFLTIFVYKHIQLTHETVYLSIDSYLMCLITYCPYYQSHINQSHIPSEILKQEQYTCAVDLWAVGVITYILLCGRMPFDEESRARLYKQILKAKYSFEGEVSGKGYSKFISDCQLCLSIQASNCFCASLENKVSSEDIPVIYVYHWKVKFLQKIILLFMYYLLNFSPGRMFLLRLSTLFSLSFARILMTDWRPKKRCFTPGFKLV